MDPGRVDRIDTLFLRARELPSGARAAFVARESADDPGVRDEVLRLLGARTDGFLEAPDRTASAPERIGPYGIVRELGRGGMGVVYLAEQEQPVRRRVALKVIRRGMVTPEILARFGSEQQALALMNHSAIARVYDAGVTEEGTPYFAMEYVEGPTLQEFCDGRRLSLRRRLALFADVCDGVQHAHQKGIVHRDIKAANVLVAVESGRPVPKLIDFGIAKTFGEPLTGEARKTQFGQLVGTLDCMAPEQLDWAGHDVDTRADVYALGVLLYELVAGARPYDLTVLRRAGLEDALRRLRREEPPAPSAKLAGIPFETLRSIAAARDTEPRALVRAVRGDVDRIVLHALEKERERRYPAASELAADVRRHLADEPVLARTPGALYRVGRFARRNKVVVGAAAVTALALVAGTFTTGVGFLRARRAERAARQEAATADEVTGYLVKVFRSAKPERAEGRAVTVREVLDANAAKVREDLADKPGVKGRVMVAMGEAYGALGLYATAIPLFDDALPLLEQEYGRESTVVFNAENERGSLASRIGAFADARRHFEAAAALAARIGADEGEQAIVRRNLGEACAKLGDLDAARRHTEAALAIQTRLFDEDSGAAAKTLSSLSSIELAAGHVDEAVRLAERSLAIRKARYAVSDPAIGHGYFALGEAQSAARRFDAAVASYGAALPVWEAAYGADHANVAECLFGLAQAQAALGRRDAAYASYRRSRAIMERAFDPNDARLAATLAAWLRRYAAFLGTLGRGGEAEEALAAAARVSPAR